MKLTKQQLIKVIKEELNAMLAEGDPLDYHQSGVHIVPTGTGFSRSTLGPPMAPEEPKYVDAPHDGGIPVVWDGPLAYPDPRFVRDFSTYEQDVEAGRAAPSWEEAREAADTGWGWGSLEETIKENLTHILKELDAATVSVRVKKLPQPGDPPSPRYLTPAQANLLGPGLKPGTPGEVPEEEWKKGGRVKFAWPRGVKGAGRRKTRYIQKDYLQTDPWG